MVGSCHSCKIRTTWCIITRIQSPKRSALELEALLQAISLFNKTAFLSGFQIHLTDLKNAEQPFISSSIDIPVLRDLGDEKSHVENCDFVDVFV